MSDELPYDLSLIYSICSDSVTNELLDLYQQTCSIFEQSSYTGHILELEHIYQLLSSQAISHSDAIDSVLETMITAGEEALNILGVTINEDIQLSLLNKLLDALLLFDVTEFPSTMFDIVEASEDPIECLAELMNFISVEDTNIWYENIVDVEPFFVDNLRLVLNDAIDKMHDVPLVIDKEFNKRRKQVLEVVPESITIDSTTEEKDLEELYDIHHKELQGLSMESSIKEIIALASISKSTPQGRIDALESILDKHIGNPMERLKYNRIIKDTIVNLEHVIYG